MSGAANSVISQDNADSTATAAGPQTEKNEAFGTQTPPLGRYSLCQGMTAQAFDKQFDLIQPQFNLFPSWNLKEGGLEETSRGHHVQPRN